MVNSRFVVLFVLSLTITSVMCQSFQYSHGWTNGKRSTSPILEDFVNSGSKNVGQLDNVLVNCELQKLRLLLQGNINNQLLQLPCELLNSPKRSFSENMVNDHFHRQPTLANNNY
ncbi:Pro-corazonin [Eufriesea mexicana]|uniref:Pro-corazonin n=1 Tax=Eufriesea mexicana TaxID=516756 RepID=A0A310SA93_9HYME|nr:PREDICTED: pro-corazonin-like [Eufriesea mexicana]OAD55904.1 Pro-corazonin [Eufriesea mexicana]